MKKLSCLLIFFILNSCSVNPVTGQQDFVMMSENQEISLGKKYHAQVLQQTPAYNDQELQDYVQEIGDSLSIKSHRPNLFYRFTVLDSPDINAFALPGGYIYINRGLMAYLSSEEELAAGGEEDHDHGQHFVMIEEWESIQDRVNFGRTLSKEHHMKVIPYLLPNHSHEFYEDV